MPEAQSYYQTTDAIRLHHFTLKFDWYARHTGFVTMVSGIQRCVIQHVEYMKLLPPALAVAIRASSVTSSFSPSCPHVKEERERGNDSCRRINGGDGYTPANSIFLTASTAHHRIDEGHLA